MPAGRNPIVDPEPSAVDNVRLLAAALRESETRFQHVVTSLPEHIYIWQRPRNGKAVIVYMSPQVETLTGYPRRRFLEDWSYWLETAVLPADREAAKAQVARLLRGEAGVVEYRLLRPDGRILWVRDSARTELDASGNHTVYGVIADITERKEAEDLIFFQKEQLEAHNKELKAQNEELLAQGRALAEAEGRLEQVNSELERRIEARTTELKIANAALVRAARLKDEFLATMSHELRTPLTAVLGLAEAIQMQVYGPVTDKQGKALGAIRESGQHLLDLIADILDLSKLEAGKLTLDLGPAPVLDICEASLRFVRQMAQKKNLRVSVDYHPEAQVLQADARRLKQMLVNLLTNAVKFTLAGGEVSLKVEADPGRRQMRFVIQDTGIGIAPEDLPRLFQPFTQLDSRLNREHEGAGLGLSLVQRLAELHGGEVTAESEGVPGQGSRFTLTLPWQAGPSPAASPAQPHHMAAPRLTPGPSSGRVLLVDDNESTLFALTGFLESQGYEVQSQSSGEQALRQAEASRPDILLMDIQMPGMDGLEVIRRLRAHPTLSTVPIIALTALAMKGDRELCLAAGADDYLSKPVNLAALAQLVRQMLERRPRPA